RGSGLVDRSSRTQHPIGRKGGNENRCTDQQQEAERRIAAQVSSHNTHRTCIITISEMPKTRNFLDNVLQFACRSAMNLSTATETRQEGHPHREAPAGRRTSWRLRAGSFALVAVVCSLLFTAPAYALPEETTPAADPPSSAAPPTQDPT